MKIKISHKAIEELVNMISNLIMKYKKTELDYILLKLAIYPFYTDGKKNEVEQILSNINSIYLDNKEIIDEFNEKYLEWIRKYYPEYEKDVYKIKEFEEEEIDFFDFDSEDVDNSINNMHYTTKIPADEFMNEIGVDGDIILDIQELLKELKEIVEFHITLDEEYIEMFSEVIKKLIYVLELSVEFKNLSKGLKNLLELLHQNFDENQKKLLKQFLDTIYYDLEKWVDEVLINQTAKDIHYLDAALLANIAQIKIILGSSND